METTSVGSAGTTAPSTATQATPTSTPSQSPQTGKPSQTGNQSASSQYYADNKSTNPNFNGETTPQEGVESQGAIDDAEEIALNGVKGKVPKTLAKVIKDMERGMHAKFQEHARLQKIAAEREQLLNLFQQNPDEFAKRTGVDLDSFAEQRLARKYELMTATPEQRELFETRQQLQEYQSQELNSKKGVIEEIQGMLGADAPKELEKYPKEELQAFLQHQKQVYEQQHTQLDQEIAQAWSEVGLPKNKYFGALMSFHMLNHQKRTGEVLPAREAAVKVKSDFLRSVSEIMTSLDPSGIQEVLGKETLEKLRKHDIDRVTGNAASKVGIQSPGQQPVSEAPKKYLNQFEWRKAMGIG